MSGEPELEMDNPYWRLDEGAGTLSLPRLLRRLPASVVPVVRLIRRSAPRATVVILVLQLASGCSTPRLPAAASTANVAPTSSTMLSVARSR